MQTRRRDQAIGGLNLQTAPCLTNREAVEKAIEDALEQRKNDPVESQMDLFGGAQVA